MHHERLEARDAAVAGGAGGAGGAVLLDARVAIQEVQAGQHHTVALHLQGRRRRRSQGRRGAGARSGGGVW